MKEKIKSNWKTRTAASVVGLLTLTTLLSQARADDIQALDSQSEQSVSDQTKPSVNDDMSQSELMRRARVNEELKNEVALQRRLEELHAQEDKKKPESTSLSSQHSKNSELALSDASSDGQSGTDVGTSTTSLATDTATADRLSILVMPVFGLSGFVAGPGIISSGRYSMGLEAGLRTNDQLSFTLGYRYSEYGISNTSSSSLLQSLQNAGLLGTQTNLQTMALKQNVIDANMRYTFLDASTRIRPFVGLGLGYGVSFVNYDASVLSTLGRLGYTGLASDELIQSFLGVASTGVEVRLSKNIRVGALIQYHAVLTTRQTSTSTTLVSSSLGAAGTAPSFAGITQQDIDRSQVGSALSNAGFYSVMLGMAYSF
jgi:hypothetical protein